MTETIRLARDGRRSMSARVALTQGNVCQQVCPAHRPRVLVYDQKTKGLVLQVTRTGSRSFYFYGRVKGEPRPVKYHIGDVAAVSLDQARRSVAKILGDASLGIDPNRARREAAEKAKRSITVKQLWERYRDEHVKPNCSEKSLTNDTSLSQYLASINSRPILSLSPAEVVELHERLTRSKTGNVADKTVKLLRRMLTWIKLSPNVAAGAVKFHGDNQRDRFLTNDEVGRLLAALENCAHDGMADAIRFALLTGARKGNVCGARWQDIHLEQGLWVIPKDQSKNGKPMTINLSPPAVELLRGRLDDRKNDFVFPGPGENKPLKDVRSAWHAARKAAGIPDVHFHDLRHTVASWMAMSGASLLLIGKQLGHASKQSSARYAHLEIGAVRAATDAALGAMMAKPTKRSAAKKQ